MKFELRLVPEDMSDRDKLNVLLENALRVKRYDIVRRCEIRLFQLAGLEHSEPIHQRFWEMIAAYESLLTQINGKKTQASRTRQKVKRVGVLETLTSWVKSAETTGFSILLGENLSQYTGEYIVAEFPYDFPVEIVESAIARLNEYNIQLPQNAIQWLTSRD